MAKTQIALNATIGFEELPVLNKIAIPIGRGKLGPLSYKQHDTDPLTIDQMSIQYGNADHLNISLRISGRIAVGTLPDVKLGGLKIEISAGLTVHEMKLQLLNPQITRWDMPNMPGPVDNLVRQLLNKSLVKQVGAALKFDLSAPLEKVAAQINEARLLHLTIGKQKLAYALQINVEVLPPRFLVAPGGIRFMFDMALAPTIGLAQQTVLRAVSRPLRTPSRRSRKKTT